METQSQETEAPREVSLDPAQQAYLMQQLRAEENFVSALLAGFVSAALGAGAWAMITLATGYQIGFMAIGVGYLVGFAVRSAGKGLTTPYGLVGAGFALLGCGVGNLLAITALVAEGEGVGFLSALGQLDASLIQDLLVATFSPMDLLFYGIAIFEGYRLSFRQVGEDELRGMLSGPPGA